LKVYVESNFVLELALVQEQHASCEQIVILCEAGDIQIIVPAYSIVEPYETLKRHHLDRERLKEALDRELQQLSRTSGYAQQLNGFQASTALLLDSAAEEIKRLEDLRSRLLACAIVVALDALILSEAARYQAKHGLSAQDAIVYASVLSHLGSEAAPQSCFLNRDKHFADPDVVAELNANGCKLIPRFDSGLSYVKAHLSSA
jgi:predicted nucleic acid-binding protein